MRVYVSVGALALVLLCCVGSAAACSGSYEFMQCNAQYWCENRGIPYQFNGDADDCICEDLCNDAEDSGGSCSRQEYSEGTAFSITFDDGSGDNYYRGTVFCDPRGGKHGHRRLLRGSQQGST